MNSDAFGIEIRLSHKSGYLELRTLGMTLHGKGELILESPPNIQGYPLTILEQMMQIIANQVVVHDLKEESVISVGDAGHVRLVPGLSENEEQVLYLRDLDEGAEATTNFLARFFATAGFDEFDLENYLEAVELFNVALQIHPDDAHLLQARASVTHDALATGIIGEELAPTYSLRVFDDLLRSISISPDRPEVYHDLRIILQSFKPMDIGEEEHQQWKRQIIEVALSNPSLKPEVLEAQNALRELSI